MKQNSLLVALLVGVSLWGVATASVPARLSHSQLAAIEADGRIATDVVEAVVEAGAARVMLSFDVVERSTGRALHSMASPGAVDAVFDAGEKILQRLPAEHFALKRRFRAVNALAGVVDAEGLMAIHGLAGVKAVVLDVGGTGSLREAIPLAKTDRVRKEGKSGKRMVVAVFDSGMDNDHPSLRSARKAERCFCSGGGGCCPNGSSDQTGRGAGEDDEGHGTNVTGIIASRGKQGVPKGGAPKAKIVTVKVLDSNNSFCCSSDIIAGLDYIITQRPDVDVVNMSLGTSALFGGNCDRKGGGLGAFYAMPIDTLWDLGVPVVASSGNEGDRKKMPLPACVKNTISVGATYDVVSPSRNWGPCSDGAKEPGDITCFANTNQKTDLVAPGAFITSTGIVNGGNQTSTFVGTSQAAPMVTACVTLLLKKYPGATPRQIENALKTGDKVRDPKNGRMLASLDCERAFASLEAIFLSDD